MNHLINQSLGRYHILEQLGEGGMAVVYKAYDTHLERDVAVKVIRSDAFPAQHHARIFKRFEREAKALAKLSQPNIVGVIEYGEHEGVPFLVMEYVSGGTLKQRLGKQIPWQETVHLLIPVAYALEYAHKHGIVHRDVKPSNILITESGEPMLTDFGIAKILEAGDGQTLSTTTGVGVGTPEYMAPEQGLGREVDVRADIYSLGIVLYELITGKKPFRADTPMAVIVKHINDPLPRPRQFVRDLPEAVERVLFKALAKKPEDRYHSMAEFRQALDRLLKSLRTQEEGMARREAAHLQRVHAEKIPRTTPVPFPQISILRRKQLLLLAGAGIVLFSGITLMLNGQPGFLPFTLFAPPTSTSTTTPTSTPTHIPTQTQTATSTLTPSPTPPSLAVEVKFVGRLSTSALRIAWSPDGQRLAAVGDAALSIWDPFSRQLIGRKRLISPSNEYLMDVDWSSDGEALAVSDSNGQIYILAATSLGVIRTFSGAGDIWSVAWSPDGSKLASASYDGLATVWDARTGDRLLEFEDPASSPLLAVSWSPNGKQLALAGDNKIAYVVDSITGKMLPGKEYSAGGNISSIAWSPDGSLVSYSSFTGPVYIRGFFDSQYYALRGHQDAALSVDWTKSGLLVASGGGDPRIIGRDTENEDTIVRVWNWQSGEILALLDEPANRVWEVRWSPDDRYLAAASEDGFVFVWEIIMTNSSHS